MIIHQPEIIQKDGLAILWSKIEMAQKRENFPDYLWYRVPEHGASYLSTQSDPFLVAALLAGMYYGEDIHVRGTTSPRLAYHLDEYQFLLNLRMPKVVSPVSIQYEHLAPTEGNPTAVGSTFSGGVDSLFTVWKHLPQNQPDPNYQVTHGIFIRGFDILHSENDHYQQLFSQYTKQALKYHIELIELETNVFSIIHHRMEMTEFLGPLVISNALALSRLFQRFYIPSSDDYYIAKDIIYASDPLIDGFLSTDTMDIIHHGATNRRIEKIEQIANWKVAQELLWVCQEAKFEETTWNCSRCEKCMRTMIPLYIFGVLDKYKKFEKPIQKNREVLWYARKFGQWSNFYFVNEITPFSKRFKPDLKPWLYLATILGYLRYWIVKYLPSPAKRWLRRYGYFITRNEALDAYEIHEITELIQNKNAHS